MNSILYSLFYLTLIAPFSSHAFSFTRSKDKQEPAMANFYNFNIQNNKHTLSISRDLQEWLQNNKEKTLSFLTHIAHHKYLCGLGGICTAYSYISYEMYRLHTTLKKNESWSLWRSDKSLEQLFEIPQQELGRQLLVDIQQRYTTADNPADFVQPLMLFMQSIEQEAAHLKKYSSFVNFIEKCKACRFFYYNKQLHTDSDNRLKRLAYIKSTFVAWLAQYKVDKAPQRSFRSQSAELIPLAPFKTENTLEAKRSAYWEFLRNM